MKAKEIGDVTAKEIMIDWLTTHGYDGLYGEECGCLLDDLMPCGEGCEGCQGGVRMDIAASTRCGCDGQGTDHWHVAPKGWKEKLEEAKRWTCECGAKCDPWSYDWLWHYGWQHAHPVSCGHRQEWHMARRKEPTDDHP